MSKSLKLLKALEVIHNLQLEHIQPKNYPKDDFNTRYEETFKHTCNYESKEEATFDDTQINCGEMMCANCLFDRFRFMRGVNDTPCSISNNSEYKYTIEQIKEAVDIYIGAQK